MGLFVYFPVDAIIDPNVPAIFYPFGSDVGDSVAPVNDDGSTANIPISMGFPFFNSTNVNLYVSPSRTLPCVDLKWPMWPSANVNYIFKWINQSIYFIFLLISRSTQTEWYPSVTPAGRTRPIPFQSRTSSSPHTGVTWTRPGTMEESTTGNRQVGLMLHLIVSISLFH